MAIVGSLQTVRSQAPSNAAFGVAWEYIDELLRPGSPVHARMAALARGDSQKHELRQGVLAIEQAYETKPRSEGFFESHRKYIDIQVVVAGHEVMEVIDAAATVVDRPYDEARDLATYRDVAVASVLQVKAGGCAVFFPSDVHMPSLREGAQPVLVRKTVLKVPVGA